MKKIFARFALICLSGLIAVTDASAQQKLLPADVRKILLSTAEGGLDGGITVDIEILNEHGKWNSYQTNYNDFNVNRGANASKISAERKLIASLSQLQVADFLNSASVAKAYNDTTFSITTEQLLADIPKKLKEPSKANIARFEALVTKESVQKAKREVIREISPYDWGKNCTIDIVKANGDTLKMSTRYLHITMLPWTINNVDTYDMNINSFFMAAMGNENYPNRDVLDINNLEGRLYNYLEGNHVAGTLNVARPEGYLMK